MTFNRSDIRPAMDVFTRDNWYLGVVLLIIPGPLPTVRQAGIEPVSHRSLEHSSISGELLGPMPTQGVGNTGPIAQSAKARYAINADTFVSLGHGSIIVGKWYGLFGRKKFPLHTVQTVSLERVVLRLIHAEL